MAQTPGQNMIEIKGDVAHRLEANGALDQIRAQMRASVYRALLGDQERGSQVRGADALRPFAFEGMRPDLEPNGATGKAFAGAIRLGHFYVVVGNRNCGKLTRQSYLKLAAQVTVGFQKRLADCKREEAVHEAVRAACHVPGLHAVSRWVAAFGLPSAGYCGGTRLGKSMFAADILGHIARQLGLPGFLEVGPAKKIGLANSACNL
eukprot:s1211_g2.t1